ncbi:MAG TPA: hypothetical protein VGT40_08570 [Methylomirabilota bacterium]|nr:hypothetical protein [Methylomirabilota bacterium]
MGDWTGDLEDLVAHMRAGETEIGRRMFETRRPRRQHLAWLRFQIAREARNLEEIADHHLCRLAESTETSSTREELVHRLMEDYQEARHYAMLAYVYEGLGGEPLRWKMLREEIKTAAWYEASRREHARWDDFRRAGATLELAAALYTRGGGGALFCGFVGLGGGDYETLLAEASKVILKDELEHGASEGRDQLFGLIRNGEDVETARRVIVEMSGIRLRMRNEQFSRVLPDARLKEIEAGSIAPLTVPAMRAACSSTTADWFALYHARPKPLSSASLSD